MGVKLKDIIEPKKIDFKDLEGRAVSIDAFNTLYQFLSTIRQRDGRPLTDENGNVTSHLSGILYRNSSMVESISLWQPRTHLLFSTNALSSVRYSPSVFPSPTMQLINGSSTTPQIP
jgi:hypothetical protein